MTPEVAADPLAESPQAASTTAGMTTKVVKGTAWTFVGQVAPLAASFICTPFVIRLLGNEQYGLYVLIVLLPTYLTFADFGMGMASTKFAAEAYAERDAALEARIVRTAMMVALSLSIPIAAVSAILAGNLANALNVPPEHHAVAVVAIRITAVTFVLGLLNNILNTPQLSRLRMDLNTFVNAVPRIVGTIAAPIVIYMGYGVVGAVTVLMFASLATFVGHAIVSRKLLPYLPGLSIERSAVRPMLMFGGALVLASVAAVLLVNLEKLVLVRATDVKTLAYYSVAFTLINMLTLFSAAMGQSLIPAFAQLLGERTRGQLRSLYARTFRVNVFLLPPLLVTLACIANPFFTFWAGPDFGRESTLPFHILLAGLFFNLNAYVPWALLLASGRTSLFAKNYWIQLLPYIALVTVLTSRYGAVGAAAAWSIRAIADGMLMVVFVKRYTNLNTGSTRLVPIFAIGIAILAVPVFCIAVWGYAPFALGASLAAAIAAYVALMWRNAVDADEKRWLTSKLATVYDRS